MRDYALHGLVIHFMALIGLALMPLSSFALQYGSSIENTEWKLSG